MLKKILNRDDLVSHFKDVDKILKHKTKIVLLGAGSLLMLF